MEIRESMRGDVVVLEIIGRLDAVTYEDLAKKISSLFESGRIKFIFDLSGLEYISSAGLRVFLSAARESAKKNGTIVLCSMTQTVRQVFEISGLASLFTLKPSMDDALSSFGLR